jgi:hypothetical protein
MNITTRVEALVELAKTGPEPEFAKELELYVRQRLAGLLKVEMKELKDGTLFFIPREVGQDEVEAFIDVMSKSGLAEGKKIGLVLMDKQAIKDMRILKM